MKHLFRENNHKVFYNELVLNIDPAHIKYYGEPYANHSFFNSKNRKNKFYRTYINYLRLPLIINKNVDNTIDLFENEERYQFMKELWDSKYEYTETKRYSKFINRLSKGEIIHKKNKYIISSESDLSEYFRDYENLLRSMNKHGYKLNIDQDDILIWIGPDGKLIKYLGGRHRLAAAQITETKRVPVRIRHIHQKCVESLLNKTYSQNESPTISDISNVLKKIRKVYDHKKFK